MSGKPAARMGDMTLKGGHIVQGSAGVMIGAPNGIACSVCPGAKTSGNPVNPLLGSKVFPGETDITFPGPLPFYLSRSYSSYRTRTPAPVGVFGPGWKAPSEFRLTLLADELILNDTGGRSIHFHPLAPGETVFSRSESLWLARGGTTKLHESNVLHRLWQRIPEDLRLSPHTYFAANSAQGPWWILGWSERSPEVDEVLPAPLPPYRVLTGQLDRFGKTLRYHRDAEGSFSGCVTAVTDGAGRRFRLILTTQSQRAEAASMTACSSDDPQLIFPEIMPVSGFGKDKGIRLMQVWLTHDPDYPDNLPSQPLVRYEYTPRGELSAVYDRSGSQIRSFEYDAENPGRMVAHQFTGRPRVTYRYDSSGRVVEQSNPASLSYRYEYGRNQVCITDSFGRREVLHTEGDGGLKRVVSEEHADGSTVTRKFDNAGRLQSETDAAGRTTAYRLDVSSGNVTEIVTPDGRSTAFFYNDQRQLTSTLFPDGLRIRFEYDAHGRLTKTTSRTGETTRWFYDEQCTDLPSSTLDASGNTHEMTWTRYGQLLTASDCSGYQTRYEYDRFGQLTALHQEEGLSLYQFYDNRGQLTSRRNSAGQENTYRYNAAGDLTSVTHPDGSHTEMQYDPAGRPVCLTKGGASKKAEYDAAGRVIALINENNASTLFEYDLLNRLTESRGFDGRIQRYGYDLTGKRIRSEDEGIITHWSYDAADRLIRSTVNGEETEHWRYDERGWLTELSHLSDGHRVSIHYEYDAQGRINCEQQRVYARNSHELLWQHATRHEFSNGFAKRITLDKLPSVEWLTYGSGYLAGAKMGNVPLIEFQRDRLHRETLRMFGTYEQNSTYDSTGQLKGQTLHDALLNRTYDYNQNGQLAHITGLHREESYTYDAVGNLHQSQVAGSQAADAWFIDPAGNRVAEPGKFASLPSRWPDNRTAEDERCFYHYDEYGRLIQKDERRICPSGAPVHYYRYDFRHRLVHYRYVEGDVTCQEARYLYDPAGRRICKEARNGDIQKNGAQTTWYGWEGDRLTTTQTPDTRVQTLYSPGSFTPLLRVATAVTELEKGVRRTLAEKLQQDGGVTFPAELIALLNKLEVELQDGQLSEENQHWLASCGLTPERMLNQIETVYVPKRRVHLYQCDHRGLPLALIGLNGQSDWSAEFDAWGNLLTENNPSQLQQLLRLPGQQYDDESGLHYNRHRYYDPKQGRYITQDPIGLQGGWNAYLYPVDPVRYIDPLGLDLKNIPNFKFDSQDEAALFALKMCNSQSIRVNREYGGLICKTKDNKYIASEGKEGSLTGFSLSDSRCPFNTSRVGDYHTHGFYSDLKGNPVSPEFDVYDSLHFSKQDINGISQSGVGNPAYTGYLSTPENKYFKFTPQANEIEEIK